MDFILEFMRFIFGAGVNIYIVLSSAKDACLKYRTILWTSN
jgi:hypothetical protein